MTHGDGVTFKTYHHYSLYYYYYYWCDDSFNILWYDEFEWQVRKWERMRGQFPSTDLM